MRFTVDSNLGNKDFKTYKAAFDFYMSIRDDASWLYVYDNSNCEYLICENCSAK